MIALPRITLLCIVTALAVSVYALALAQDTADDEGTGWPREVDMDDGGVVVVYQPQMESYKDNTLEARAAVGVTPAGASAPIFGAMWFKCQLSTDLDTRMVTLINLDVTGAKFPDAEEDKVNQLSSFLETEAPTWNFTFSLDRLLASVEGAETAQREAANLNNDPPEVIFVKHPAVLIVIDGDPKLADLEDSSLKYVVNTPYYILQDPKTKKYYLKGGDYWFATKDIMGTWTQTDDLPSSVADVAKQVDEEVAKQKQEAEADGEAPEGDEDLGEAGIPEIIVRTQPAELVQTDGEPAFAPIEGTNLLYMQNTETDVILDIDSQLYYILISGRWYSSNSMEGPWTFVAADKVPADFAKIPADSDMGQVLMSVAGTQEAHDAILENTVPQTAEVDRKTATVTVTYDGDPKFEKCSDDVAYAINTDKSVLLIDNTYYCCDEAIWFVSKGPTGPWEVATSVPAQIQDIPPDCPAYNVKYVYIYDSTPDVVYVGYTPGYVGSYYYGGVIVYGTGWYYHPWYGAYYYPRPVTWGFHVHYNPWTGWGFSFGVSYGWLHIGVGRPWHRGWGGPAGYRHGYRHGYHRGYRHGYHHGARAGYRAGYKAGQRQHHNNMYRNRSSGVRNTGATHARASSRGAGSKTMRKSNQPNNVYADRNGQVHRNNNGNWQQHSGGNWSSSQNRSSSQRSNQSLNRDQQSRQRGNQRATQSHSRSRGGGRRR